MTPIATYVFLDLETTGIPSEENNKTKITELSMVAVKRDHLLETRPGASPRVQHRLTLCFNPGRMIAPGCTEVTGLNNDLLEHESMFDHNVFNIINTFLIRLTKPVCLIAQNGHSFDFPILKNHLVKLKVNFSDDLLCADCYQAFYDILEASRSEVKTQMAETSVAVNGSVELTRSAVNELYSDAPNTLAMKQVNETTPKQKTVPARTDGTRISKARRRFPWSAGEKPKDSYKLKDIYERLLNRPGMEAHRAENDCVMALECSVTLARKFVDWVDNEDNHLLFSTINPMTFGKRLGD